jgi:hypothetical protein
MASLVSQPKEPEKPQFSIAESEEWDKHIHERELAKRALQSYTIYGLLGALKEKMPKDDVALAQKCLLMRIRDQENRQELEKAFQLLLNDKKYKEIPELAALAKLPRDQMRPFLTNQAWESPAARLEHLPKILAQIKAEG